jgi:alpha-1,6-mannosyltransferase
MISHERVDRLLGQFGLPPALARQAADRRNARLVAEFDVVVCATAFTQAEFDRIGAPVQRVLFGVDLDTFSPAHRSPDRSRTCPGSGSPRRTPSRTPPGRPRQDRPLRAIPATDLRPSQ